MFPQITVERIIAHVVFRFCLHISVREGDGGWQDNHAKQKIQDAEQHRQLLNQILPLFRKFSALQKQESRQNTELHQIHGVADPHRHSVPHDQPEPKHRSHRSEKPQLPEDPEKPDTRLFPRNRHGCQKHRQIRKQNHQVPWIIAFIVGRSIESPSHIISKRIPKSLCKRLLLTSAPCSIFCNVPKKLFVDLLIQSEIVIV